ncbi:MAG TPA: hypothetical protein VN832_05550 [Stellaceae bacterium]|nr:hypothetical protein [Stellaceae bacterium]
MSAHVDNATPTIERCVDSHPARRSKPDDLATVSTTNPSKIVGLRPTRTARPAAETPP